MTVLPFRTSASASARPIRDRLAGIDPIWIAVLVSTLFVLVAVLTRPLIPIDETRYLTVAWEMRLSGDWLVPHLNGEAYSHKPPMLFWLINLAWAIFGEHEVVARLVPASFLPLTVWLAGQLGRRIGGPTSQGRDVGGTAAMISASFVVFAVSSTLVMFDAMLTAAVLAGLIGLSLAAEGRWMRGFALVGAMIGLGVLIKGPAILIHLLPAALLAPLWADARRNWLGWYVGVAVAIGIGGTIALAWALPAAQSGGAEFGRMILWGQTTGRMVKAFDHARPVWYYAALSPLLLLPWSLSRNLWSGVIAAIRARAISRADRLPWIAAAGTFVLFSLISGKQIHYLAPAYPCLAIGIGLILSRTPARSEPAFAVVTFVFGLAMVLIYPSGVMGTTWPPYAFAVAGAVTMLGSVAVWHWRRAVASAALAATAFVFAGLHVGALLGGLALHDPAWITPWLMQGSTPRPIAVVGNYAGEYGYLARLRDPVDQVAGSDAASWLATHPGGALIQSYRDEPAISSPATALKPYRKGMLGVWIAPSTSPAAEY